MSNDTGTVFILLAFATIVNVLFSSNSTAQHWNNVADIKRLDSVQERFLEDFAASPNAKGPLENVTLVTPRWKHTHLSNEEVRQVDAEKLARGYLALKYVISSVELADGGATVYTWVNGSREMVDKANVGPFLKDLEERQQSYRKAIESRGYRKLGFAYDVKSRELNVPSLVEQNGFEFTWSDGSSLHSGVVVENALALENADNPEISLIGLATDNEIELRMEAVGAAAQIIPDEERFTWIPTDGNTLMYAKAHALRAMARMQNGAFKNAVDDLTRSIEINPKLAIPYVLRSQIYSCCPNSSVCDGKKALDDAAKYCTLKVPKSSEQWVCDSVLAAAYAQNLDFTKAVAFAEGALKNAPDGVKDNLQARIGRYQNQKPFRGTEILLAPSDNQQLGEGLPN